MYSSGNYAISTQRLPIISTVYQVKKVCKLVDLLLVAHGMQRKTMKSLFIANFTPKQLTFTRKRPWFYENVLASSLYLSI